LHDKYDFLKVAHHGSSTSTGSSFLRWYKPEYAIISCGEDNVTTFWSIQPNYTGCVEVA